MMKILIRFFSISKIVVILLWANILSSCGDQKAIKAFQQAITAGELSEAQEHLADIEKEDRGAYVLQLIRSYIEIGEVKRAVDVYEHLAPYHPARDDMRDTYKYEYEVGACKLLREALVNEGEYKKAWQYYPLRYSNEDTFENAANYYLYISDVADALCKKRQYSQAVKFVEDHLRWFELYVDVYDPTHDSQREYKKTYRSAAVRERLLQQIDKSRR